MNKYVALVSVFLAGLVGLLIFQVRVTDARILTLESKIAETQTPAVEIRRCDGLPAARACVVTFAALEAARPLSAARKISIVGVVGTSRGVLTLFPDPYSASRRIDIGALRLRGARGAQTRLWHEADGKTVRISGAVEIGPEELVNDSALGRLHFTQYVVLPDPPAPDARLVFRVEDLEIGEESKH
jgi:hypothetical protein